MLALSWAYAMFGTFAIARNALYGVGPVVVGIFAVSIYRLARGTTKPRLQVLILIGAAMLMLFTSMGLGVALLAGGCLGIALFESRGIGLTALAALLPVFALYTLSGDAIPALVMMSRSLAPAPGTGQPVLWEIATFFLKVGAFTFGGGLSMLAFIQDQVVVQLGWLTPREFVDGLALGQLTPGPVLMLAAFIGFKAAGIVGAATATAAIFLPSFVMILSILPLLQRMQDLALLRAFMRGVGPAVIGALGVSLMQMVPAAAPDVFTGVLLVLTVAVLMLRNIGPVRLLFGGAIIGLLRKAVPWEQVARLA